MGVNIPIHHVLFSFFCGLLLLGLVVELIRRARLQERYAALWIVLALVFMTYVWWIDAAAAIARWLDIADIVPVVLFFGIFMCALLILQLSVKVSEFSIKIKNLIQEISLLKHELERHRSEAPSKSDCGEDV